MAVVLKKRKREIGATSYHKRGGEGSHLRPRYVGKTPPCNNACPMGNDIRGFLTTIAQTEDYGREADASFEMAWRTLTETNPLPAVLGRVCPHFCESDCNRQAKDEAVSINQIERFLGDYGINNQLKHEKLSDAARTEKVAVVGAGPAGLSCAFQLARRGYPVTIFEAFDKSGGMLRYGIPSYRLPEDILDAEVAAIQDLGVEIKYGSKVGVDVSVDDLKNDFDAVYLGIGAHNGWNLGIPGEDGPGVMNGVSFLNQVNNGESVELGEKVLVIGGGNTAIDATRVSWRLGSTPTVVYRRTKEEMPADVEEIEDTEAEGIHIEFLTAPVEVVRDAAGKVTGLKCIKMELGEPDESGRRRPVAVEGSEFVIEADTIIPAIGQGPDFTGMEKFEDSGWITVDEATGVTAETGFYAGGDVTNKLGTVTEAVGLGRKAAEAIEAHLKGEELAKVYPAPIVKSDSMALHYYAPMERAQKAYMAPADRRNFDEVVSTMIVDTAMAETQRCMSCGLCFDCGNCYQFCSSNAVAKLPKGQHFEFHLETCVGCKKCAEECPCGYIDMS